MTINVLDQEVVDNFKNELEKLKDGINLHILNSEGEKIYTGIVWPNEQYEYDA
jgi:hypothetical protein